MANDAASKAKPPGGIDDGKSGGHQGGERGPGNFRGHDAAGTNAQTGRSAGTETERTAPGISTEKKADDTK